MKTLEHEYYSTDYTLRDGTKTTTTMPRALCYRYLALYGEPLIPWRKATDAEISAYEAEWARIEALENSRATSTRWGDDEEHPPWR